MKVLLYIIISLFLLLSILIFSLSISSRKQPELGLSNKRLQACPATPNCVCSEWQGQVAYIEPISYSIAHAAAWASIRQAVINSGGEIVAEQDNYLHARYVTPLLRFVDDVELRLDEDQHLIHVRSASRVGHSDLGTNRKRIHNLRKLFYQLR